MSETRRQWELLQRFAQQRDQQAFAQVVAEHIDMVYSACLRQVGDRHLAEEVTQAVFVILARKAGTLGDNIVLAAWLHKTARYAALNALKVERRRKIHERKAAEIAMEMRRSGSSYVGMAGLLDEGVARLADRDRAAIMLRYFEKRSVADVGAALGVSEDAAGMRISRALLKLRSFFSRRGVSVTVAAIGMFMVRNAVEASPPALFGTIAAEAGAIGAAGAAAGVGAGAASSAGVEIVNGALRMMFWHKAKVAAAVLITMMSAAGGGTYLFHYLLTRANQDMPVEHHVQVPMEASSV